jgi:hypothetical protein
MRSEEGNDLDRILDEGLLSYSQAEPSFGLEQRVVRHAAAGVEQRKAVLRWTLATVTAALFFVVTAIQWTGSPVHSP